MIALILFLFNVQGAIQITKFYSQDLTCSSTETLWYVTQPASCTPTGCGNLNGQTATSVSCQGTLNFPPDWTFIEVWQTSTTCSGASTAFAATPSNACSGVWTSSTFSMLCGTTNSSSGFIVDCAASSPSCNGCASKPATKGGVCISGNPTTTLPISSYKWTCPAITTTTSGLTTTTTTTTTSSSLTTRPASSSMIAPAIVPFLIWFVFG